LVAIFFVVFVESQYFIFAVWLKA